MGNVKKKKRSIQMKRRAFQHKLSVILISCVLVMLGAILSVGSISLHEKNRSYKEQEAKLQEEIDAEKLRAEEISELEKYVGTDEYVEDVAKEKLGLIYPNEILFTAEQ